MENEDNIKPLRESLVKPPRKQTITQPKVEMAETNKHHRPKLFDLSKLKNTIRSAKKSKKKDKEKEEADLSKQLSAVSKHDMEALKHYKTLEKKKLERLGRKNQLMFIIKEMGDIMPLGFSSADELRDLYARQKKTKIIENGWGEVLFSHEGELYLRVIVYDCIELGVGFITSLVRGQEAS